MAPCDLPTTDRARNWIVAVCCCFINLTFYGVSRMSGIMLVATTQTFQVSRASAAVPFSLSTAIRNLAGVFVGQLGHRFGVGPVVATGSIVASLGAGLCFFAKDMQWLSIFWGGIFGFGFGLSTCLLPLAINKNFVKHNGTASGISYSGAYLGSFIFPPAVVWLLDTFGLQGTFLVISGCVLNVLIAAMLLREKKPHKEGAISQISKNSFSNATVSVICRQHETGDLWKQNINRAFIADLASESDESYVKAYISSMSQPYLLQDPVLISYSHVEEFPSYKISTEDYSSQQQVTRRCSRLLSDVSRNFKFRRSSSRSVELETIFSYSDTNPAPLSNSSSRNSLKFSKFPNGLPSKNSIASSVVGGEVISKGLLSEKYLKKLLESGLLSKGKCKAKYKLKLLKLRKILEASIFKRKNSDLKDFMQSNSNVKLTSFNNLNSCPTLNSFRLSLTSNTFHLSMPCNNPPIQGLDKENDEQICHTIVQQHIPNHNEINHPVSESEINILATLTHSKSTFPLKEEAISLSSSNNSHRAQNKSQIKLCDNTIKDNLWFSKKPYSSGISYDETSSKSSTYDNLSSTCKTESCQFSNYDPTSSSEMLHNEHLKTSGKRFKTYKSAEKAARNCCFDWIHMLKEPMFILISSTMSVQTFIVVCVVTTLEDFAKDIGIAESRTYYALMALSISNLFGTLTLGSITDRGYISRHRFLSLCFLGMSASLVALSLFAVSLSSLLSLVVFYGLMESGVIITFPILMKQFVKGERRQAVAIASSNMLSAPTVMLVPMLIGHFRDNIGCYSGLFYVLGGTSFICSFLWLVAPSVCKKSCLKKKGNQQKIDFVC